MPGSSLWVIPPLTSSFNNLVQTLITTTIPQHFPNTQTHDFIPHMTITSDIEKSTYGQDPQAWLGSLSLPRSSSDSQPVILALETLESADQFVKKLTIKAEKSHALLALAAACRAAGVLEGDSEKAAKWAQDDYLPHLSLMYAALPSSEVKKSMPAVEEDCRKATRSLHVDDSGVAAKGGSLVLVDTSKPINEWDVIAERGLDDLQWIWPWTKSRFDD